MLRSFHRMAAVVLSMCVAASGCAAAGAGPRLPAYAGSDPNANRRVLVEYVQKLPPGTLVRVVRSQHRSLRGTLMKATDESIFIQPKTRLAEAIAEVPFSDVVSVTPEPQNGNGLGRAIGAGAAAGAGATVAIFLIIIAAFGD